MVHVEDLAFIHGQRFDAVLVGVGVDRFFEGLAQDVLAALRVGDQAVHGQDQVIGDQGVGGGEEAEVAHDDAAFVVGQAFGVFPQGDVGGHVDLLRHPVVGAAVEVLLPGPVVLEGHELVEVGAAVDHALFVNGDAGGGAFEFGEAFGDVEFVQGGLGAHDGGGVTGGDGACFDGGSGTGTVEAVHVGFGGVAGVGAFGGYFTVFFFVEFVPAQHDVSSPA
ncbi:hypothetical protein BN1864_LIB5394:03577 [Pseudomonas sp. 1 R 17]|nr:hypothetical protein BN1864_LIB5394:03577 [Pseudomonas sp. 1 R 17]